MGVHFSFFAPCILGSRIHAQLIRRIFFKLKSRKQISLLNNTLSSLLLPLLLLPPPPPPKNVFVLAEKMFLFSPKKCFCFRPKNVFVFADFFFFVFAEKMFVFSPKYYIFGVVFYFFYFFVLPFFSFERLEYSAARCLRGTLSSRRRRRRRSRCRRAPTAASQGTERASAPSLRGSASCAELSDTMTRCGVSVCVGCRAASCGWA